jgi:AraC-like DNA-binding protein
MRSTASSFFLLVSVALQACLLRRRPLGGGNRFEPLIGNLLATFDGASVGALDKSLLRALNSGELSAQVIGRRPSLGRLAAELHFADQAHLTRTVHRLTGQTPSAHR